MDELPSGTVTFLFTDIEGSTRLWERDPAAMWTAIARHNAILGAAISTHGGRHFKTIGDAFQAAFPTAPDALAAAVAAQRDLAAGHPGDAAPLHVRMALHAGEATPVDGDYLAPCLNRLARLLSTGNGGQMLLSQAVQQLVRDRLPDGVTLRDLGEHRLRDLLEPERVYQVVATNLPDHFPPLKSLERHPTNLPVQPNPLVGREDELAAVKELLGRDDVRLVVLTGVGGAGKTRLGLQVAAEVLEAFEDGAYFVDLAPLTDPSLVLPTITSTLGIRESGGQPLLDALVTYLAAKRLLLVLDNFEQVLAAAPVAADLLGACAGIKILVTSRARLGLRAEHEYPVPPLSLPDPTRLPPLSELAEVDAVTLFVQRATAARHDFALTEANAAAVAGICTRLDGLPLAIELAAARVAALPPRAILERLGSRLKLLTGGARDSPVRQRTLRATIEWSHGLLPADERTLFRRVAVFAGGFGLESAEVVANAEGDLNLDVLDGVTALVGQSLLRQVDGPGDEPRFVMLETLREFGLERLEEAGEAKATRRAHAGWCVALAEEAEPALAGPEQGRWLERLETEHDNLRAALGATADGADETGLRLAGALWRFWEVRGHLSEGRGWFERFLANPPAPMLTWAKAANGAGILALCQGDYARAAARYEESLALRRELGDKGGIANSLNGLGLVAYGQGDYARAAAYHEESLALRRELGDKGGIANSLNNLGNVAYGQGDYARAVARYEESLVLVRELGDKRGIAASLNNLGNVAHAQGDYARAVAYHEESLVLKRELGDKAGIARSLANLAKVAYGQGDYDQAAVRHEESLALKRELGDKGGIAASLNGLGLVAHAQGDYDQAAARHEESLALFWEMGNKRGIAEVLEGISALAVSLSDAMRATRLFGATAALRDIIGAPAAPDERDRNERFLAEARQQLGETSFSAAWEAGRGLSAEQAAEEAMGIVRAAGSAIGAS